METSICRPSSAPTSTFMSRTYMFFLTIAPASRKMWATICSVEAARFFTFPAACASSGVVTERIQMRAATFAPRLGQLQWQGHPWEKQSSEQMRLNGVLKDQRGNESTQLPHSAKNVNGSVPVERLCGQTTWSSNQCCQPRRPSQSTKSAPESFPVHPVCRSLAFFRTLLGWRDKDSAVAFPTARFPWAIMLIASSHKAQEATSAQRAADLSQRPPVCMGSEPPFL